MDSQEFHNNAVVIYNYTETILQDINKSIDHVASKLIAVLGLSGVLIRFCADMPSEGGMFFFRALTLLSLLMAVAICGTGLYAKSRGETRLSPDYLLEAEQYRASEEDIHLILTRYHKSKISDLQNLQNFRVRCLNAGIGLIIAASIVSTLVAITMSIH